MSIKKFIEFTSKEFSIAPISIVTFLNNFDFSIKEIERISEWWSNNRSYYSDLLFQF